MGGAINHDLTLIDCSVTMLHLWCPDQPQRDHHAGWCWSQSQLVALHSRSRTVEVWRHRAGPFRMVVIGAKVARTFCGFADWKGSDRVQQQAGATKSWWKLLRIRVVGHPTDLRVSRGIWKKSRIFQHRPFHREPVWWMRWSLI